MHEPRGKKDSCCMPLLQWPLLARECFARNDGVSKPTRGLLALDIHHSNFVGTPHAGHVEPVTKKDGAAIAVAGSVRERELIAIIRELLHELRPQRARITEVSASSRGGSKRGLERPIAPLASSLAR